MYGRRNAKENRDKYTEFFLELNFYFVSKNMLHVVFLNREGVDTEDYGRRTHHLRLKLDLNDICIIRILTPNW